MIYLLDTNVISEMIKLKPNTNLKNWVQSTDLNACAISALTIGEIRKGIEKLADSAKKNKLRQWLETDVINKFLGRIVNIDSTVAEKWGYISASNNIPAIDGLLAASALVHNLKLVTRNTKDFESIYSLEIINPCDD